MESEVQEAYGQEIPLISSLEDGNYVKKSGKNEGRKGRKEGKEKRIQRGKKEGWKEGKNENEISGVFVSISFLHNLRQER